MKPAHHRYKTPKLLLLAGVFVAFIALLFIYYFSYAQSVFPGVGVGPVVLSGKIKNELANTLDKKIDEAIGSGFKFIYKDKEMLLNPIVIADQDPDLTYALVSFDAEQMANEAFAYGHDNNFFINLVKSVKSVLIGEQLPLRYSINKEKLLAALRSNFGSLESPGSNAQLVFKGGRLAVAEERDGEKFLYEMAVSQLEEQVKNLSFAPISLELAYDDPEIKKADAEKLLEEANNLIALAPITLRHEKKEWYVYPKMLGSWLTFQKTDADVELTLNQDEVQKFLDNIAENVKILPKDAKFKLENGKVLEFQDSQNGQKLDTEETYTRLLSIILKENQKKVELPVIVDPPLVTTANINNLGIKELIGKSTTSFARSPKNRRFNIKVGTEKLNGLLITPGEEFSLVSALGEISKETGYKSELVIKGDKTTPEFGGGLCQVATTVFRVALNAGLLILERQNHSYRVPYYEPPIGLDATIYSPSPDLKFKNNTDAYILIQASIAGDNLTFEFWGLKDGRQSEMTEPVVTNVVPPPPKQIIETDELPPGKEKCTERAHPGADAKFTYKITYKDGRVEEKVFRSHYKPWAEVCLVGKTATPTPAVAQ